MDVEEKEKECNIPMYSMDSTMRTGIIRLMALTEEMKKSSARKPTLLCLHVKLFSLSRSFSPRLFAFSESRIFFHSRFPDRKDP